MRDSFYFANEPTSHYFEWPCHWNAMTTRSVPKRPAIFLQCESGFTTPREDRERWHVIHIKYFLKFKHTCLHKKCKKIPPKLTRYHHRRWPWSHGPHLASELWHQALQRSFVLLEAEPGSSCRSGHLRTVWRNKYYLYNNNKSQYISPKGEHTNSSGEVKSTIDATIHGHFPSGIFDASEFHLILWLVVIWHIHSFPCRRTVFKKTAAVFRGKAVTKQRPLCNKVQPVSEKTSNVQHLAQKRHSESLQHWPRSAVFLGSEPQQPLYHCLIQAVEVWTEM